MPIDSSLLKTAVLYPWNDGESGTTLVGGGILTLLSPLLIPGLIVLGYNLRVVERKLGGDEAPPVFEGWTDLFVAGVKAAVVMLIYVVLPLLIGVGVLGFLFGLTGFRFSGGVQRFASVGRVGGLAFVVVLLLAGLALVVLYVAPAALVHLARTRRVRAALAVEDVNRLARDNAYAAAWLLALVVFAANAVVLGILNAVGVGVLLSGFVSFYAFLIMAYLYASGAAAAGVSVDIDDEEAGTATNDDEG